MDTVLWSILLAIISFSVLFIVATVSDYRKDKADRDDESFNYFEDDVE